MREHIRRYSLSVQTKFLVSKIIFSVDPLECDSKYFLLRQSGCKFLSKYNVLNSLPKSEKPFQKVSARQFQFCSFQFQAQYELVPFFLTVLKLQLQSPISQYPKQRIQYHSQSPIPIANRWYIP